MKTFVLNVKRAHLRRKYMQDQLNRLKLEYDLIDGIDYCEVSREDVEELYGGRARAEDNHVPGVLACSLSHLKICKTIIKQGHARALVLEDDIVLPDNILDILSKIERFQADDAVVLLRYYSHRGVPLSLTRAGSIVVGGGSALLPPTEIDEVASAAAYVLPTAVARAMVAQLRPIDHAADSWGFFYKKRIFNRLYCFYPNVIADAQFVPCIEYPATRSFVARLKRNLRSIGVINQVAAMLSRPSPVRSTYDITSGTPPFWNFKEGLALMKESSDTAYIIDASSR